MDTRETEEYVEKQKTDLKVFWRPRDTQIIKERKAIALIEPPKVKGFVTVTRNKPKVLYDTSVALLSGFEPKIRLPLSTQDEEQKAMMNKAERFLIGVWRELDRKQQFLGRDRTLRELAYYVCSGWYAVFPYISKVNGKADFNLVMYDPLTVYPQWGSRGLTKLVRTYRTTRLAADTLMKENNWAGEIPGNQDEVDLDNYWEDRDGSVYNTVLVAGKVAKKWTEEKRWKGLGIPLVVGAIGGVPHHATSESEYSWQERRGESVVATNLQTFAAENKLSTMVMQIIQDIAYPMIIEWTEDGLPKLRPEEVRSGGIKTYTKDRDDIKAFSEYAKIPADLWKIMATLDGDDQRGGLPYIVHGNLPFEISGFMGSQLFAGIKHKLAPYSNALQFLLGVISTEFLRQYRTGGYGKVKLITESAQRRGKGETFIEEFSAKDIPDVTYVEVTIPLAFPADKAQQILMARQAMQPPQLLSRPTLWDEQLDVQDAQLEYRRIIEDEVLELPVMKQIAAAEMLREKAASYRAQGKEDIALVVEKYAEQVEQGISQAVQQGQGGAGGVTPGGVSPETAGGGIADAMKARLGVQPTGEGGRVAGEGM